MSAAYSWENYINRVFAVIVCSLPGVVEIRKNGKKIAEFEDDAFQSNLGNVTAKVRETLKTTVSARVFNRLRLSAMSSYRGVEPDKALEKFDEELFKEKLLPHLPETIQQEWKDLDEVTDEMDVLIMKHDLVHRVFTQLRTGAISTPQMPQMYPTETPTNCIPFAEAFECENPILPIRCVNEKQVNALKLSLGFESVKKYGAFCYVFPTPPTLDVFTIIGSRQITVNLPTGLHTQLPTHAPPVSIETSPTKLRWEDEIPAECKHGGDCAELARAEKVDVKLTGDRRLAQILKSEEQREVYEGLSKQEMYKLRSAVPSGNYCKVYEAMLEEMPPSVPEEMYQAITLAIIAKGKGGQWRLARGTLTRRDL